MRRNKDRTEHVVRECLALSSDNCSLVSLIGNKPSILAVYNETEIFEELYSIADHIIGIKRNRIQYSLENQNLLKILREVGDLILSYLNRRSTSYVAKRKISTSVNDNILDIIGFLLEHSSNKSDVIALKEIFNGYSSLSIEVYNLTTIPFAPIYHSSLRVNDICECHVWSELGFTILPCYYVSEPNNGLNLFKMCSNPSTRRKLVSINHINHYRSIPLGMCTSPPIRILMEASDIGRNDYHPSAYCILERNCNTFVRQIIERLGIPLTLVPTWIDIAASIGNTEILNTKVLRILSNVIEVADWDVIKRIRSNITLN